MNALAKSIPEFLEKHPRANLLQAPAIIHKLPRLSSLLGHDIYILRDDLTGFALGGNKTGIHFSHIIHSTSSAGTQAGLVVGQCISSYDTQIIGISASLKASAQSECVHELAWSTAQMIGASIDRTKIIVDDNFVGPGYAQASKEGENAVKLFARLEGILLDSVYTGKAAAALLHYAENSRFKNGNILFIHTGGNAGVYY
ncbi:MAG: pyridoxal-phosphate dependent enzyme [bacterium]